MELIAPSGPVYQAGTLSGNPLAMTAGIETLKVLEADDQWNRMEAVAARLVEGIGQAAEAGGIPVQSTRVGTMFSTFFTATPVKDWPTVKTSDTVLFGRYFRSMLEQGVYLAPSQFEAGFVSILHDDQVIARTVEAAGAAMHQLAG